MRRNTSSCTGREIEALLDHLDELGATVHPSRGHMLLYYLIVYTMK